ncbi:hypothetical protein [Paraclostridium sp. AKS73]|nr:hypothetical protein [Paraclostridium sp. AKS73]
MSQELTFKEISNHLIEDERPSLYIKKYFRMIDILLNLKTNF